MSCCIPDSITPNSITDSTVPTPPHLPIAVWCDDRSTLPVKVPRGFQVPHRTSPGRSKSIKGCHPVSPHQRVASCGSMPRQVAQGSSQHKQGALCRAAAETKTGTGTIDPSTNTTKS